MKKILLLMLALSALGALSACSQHAMKSTPVAFREHATAEGPVEDRINLWPLFYKRDPAWSALWPLIAASDEGSAVLPIYEYDRNDEDLRVGTLTHLLPPLARFDSKDDYWRVANVAKDNKRHAFRILPLYFQDSDDPWFLLLPVFYWNQKDKTLWTPPLLKYEGGGGLFVPLLHWSKDALEKQIDLLWPLGGVWSKDYVYSQEKGVKMLPFFYAEKDVLDESSVLNLLGLLLHVKKEPEKIDAGYLIPLGRYERRSGERPSLHFRLLPFWIAESSDTEKLFFSLPYSHYASGEESFRNVLLNAYIGLHDGDVYYESFAFPFFHRFGSDAGRGHMVLPFYLYGRQDNDAWRFHSALFNFKSDGTLLNVAGPLYMQMGEPGDLYGSWLWPFYHYWEDGKTRGRAVLPLFFRTKGEGDDQTLITPLGGFGRSGDSGFVSLLWPIYTRFHRGEEGRESWERYVLFPFWRDAHSPTSDEKTLLPLFHYESREDGGKSFYSLPFSTSSGPERRSWTLGPWLFNWHKNAYTTGWSALLIAEYKRWVEVERMRWRVFPIAKHDQSESYNKTEVMDYGLVSLYKSDEYEKGRDEAHFLQVLWLLSLYDSIAEDQPNGETYTRRRVLWRLFHRETQGGIVATDIFPFIRYDRNAEKDTSGLKWVEGLLGYERQGEERRLRIFWLPVPLP